MEYEPLFACAAQGAEKQNKRAHYVVCDTYVTMSDGTGVVHIAPAFGEDDARIGRENDLPLLQFVDAHGNMTNETPFAGLFVKDAGPKVLKIWTNAACCSMRRNLNMTIRFAGGATLHCLYYARESWFIKMTAVKKI